MDSKSQFQKILDWLKQINKSVAQTQDGQDKLSHQIVTLEKKMNGRVDNLEEKLDDIFDAMQSMLKAMRSIRSDQHGDKTRFEKEIQKIRQEIRQLMH